MIALVYMRAGAELAVQENHTAYPNPTFGLNVQDADEIRGWMQQGFIESGAVFIPMTSVDRIDGPIGPKHAEVSAAPMLAEITPHLT